MLQQDDASSVGGAKDDDIEVEVEGRETWNHLMESLPIIGTSIPANGDRAAMDGALC